jgi:hypothetical protein
MRTVLDSFGLVGSSGQSPVGFPCSFAVSTEATSSLLSSGGAAVTSAPGTPDLAAAFDSGANVTDNVTNVTEPVFRVSLPPEAIEADVVRVYRAGSVEIGSKTLDGTDISNGYADVTASTLTSGDHTITARVQNAGGLSSPSSGLALAIDTASPGAPAGIVVTPADQGDHALQTANTQPTFRITLPANAVAGDVATLEIDTVDDATATLTGTDISNGYADIQSSGTLADDTLYDISAFLTDVAGNEGVSSSAVEVEVGDAINEIPAVVYVGAGYLVVNAATHGAADGAALHGAAFLRFRSDGSLMYLRASGGAQPFYVCRNADNTIEFASSGVFSCVTAAVPASTGWCLVLWSANGTTAQLAVMHAGGVIAGTNTPGSATNLSLAQDWHYGEDAAGGNRLHADVGMWWEKAAQSIDLTDSDVRENWYDTTNDILRDPGAGGGNPVDASYTPDFFVAAWTATHGIGADTAGVFTDGVSPGEYGEDYSASAERKVEIVVQSSQVAGSSDTWMDTPVLLSRACLPAEMCSPTKANAARPDGGDIRAYTDSSLTTQLPLEVVQFAYDSSDGEGDAVVELRIKRTITSDTNTSIWLNYNNGETAQPTADSTYGSESVWRPAYAGVFHLNEASGNVSDSTANGNTLAANGSPSGYGASGQVGAAIDLDGLNDRFTGSGTGGSLHISGALTMRAWIKRDTLSAVNNEFIAGKYNTAQTTNGRHYSMRFVDGGEVRSICSDTGIYNANLDVETSGAGVATLDPHCVVMRFTPSTELMIDVDNANRAAVTTSIPSGLGGIPVQFEIGAGLDTTNGDYFHNGIIDEVQVIAEAVDDNLLTTLYNNEKNPGGFAVAGAPTNA